MCVCAILGPTAGRWAEDPTASSRKCSRNRKSGAISVSSVFVAVLSAAAVAAAAADVYLYHTFLQVSCVVAAMVQAVVLQGSLLCDSRERLFCRCVRLRVCNPEHNLNDPNPQNSSDFQKHPRSTEAVQHSGATRAAANLQQ